MGAKVTHFMKHEYEITDADVYINFSKSDKLTDKQLMSMADGPVVMYMDQSNEEASTKMADDAIIFTGGKSISSLIFPYMIRAVLETEASEINVEMKLAAIKELD